MITFFVPFDVPDTGASTAPPAASAPAPAPSSTDEGGLADICKIDPKQCATIDLKAAAARPFNSQIFTGSPRPLAWVGIGGRNAFGFESPLNGDFGVELMAGRWAFRGELQPLMKVGWSRENRGGATIDAARFGPGIGFGWWAWDRRAWVGGALEGAYVHTWARTDGGGETREAWSGSVGVSALAQFCIARYFLLGIQAGPEVDFPTLHFQGDSGGAAWGPVRFNFGLRLGVVIEGYERNRGLEDL
jgi:hypothetical protein